VGYLENRDAEGLIVASRDPSRDWPVGSGAFNLAARSLYNRYFMVKPGASVSSGRLLFLLSADPFSALESFAETMGRVNQVRHKPPLNGFCSWLYTHEFATEVEQLKNAEFIAAHLKPYGMEYVQIDYGYQKAFGDWESNERYPHGMKWLAGKIRDLGLKPGIWIMPYAIAENTDVARNHPEWLIRDSEGRLQNHGFYGLDVTRPGARRWLYDLMKKVSYDWDYDFIKVDGAETVLAAEKYYDPTLSKAQAYRLAIETIRSAVGPDRFLTDDGPGQIAAGVVDSAFIDFDLAHSTWDQYTKNFNSVAPAMAQRYYFQKRVWNNDAYHLGLELLTVPQAQAAASLIGLSGGMLFADDRLYELDPARLAILKKVFPAYGEAARPIDLFEKARPEIFALNIRKDFGQWCVLGHFNWREDTTALKDLNLAWLGLGSTRRKHS
jgi:alpha-galactosidase